ncbi:MAG: hypothetical protein A2X08_01045 [Bacteroidetes bacterium GWA2_32_17]|nr:MAG: hypothetical protein A2X08_01045 [Bacteroidetes bacterium GWA2_32_17]
MEENIKKEVAYFMRRLYRKGLTTSLGGNISCKYNDKIFITPSQLDKGRINSEHIGIVDFDGNNLTPSLKLSMETQMHISVYKKRPDVNAIVHAHPPCLSFFAVSRRKINSKLLGESRTLLGEPAYAKYALMGSKELAEIVSKASKSSNIVILENHGVLTLGENLITSFDRIEVGEIAARLSLFQNIQGNVRELNEQQLAEIDNLMKRTQYFY